MKTSLIPLALLLTAAIAYPSDFSINARSLEKRCPPFDPAGVKNIGNNAGIQFIGGQCLSNTDCASNCCALPCGICSGLGAQFQAGKQGCGFGSGAAANGSAGVPSTTSGSAAVGTGVTREGNGSRRTGDRTSFRGVEN